MSVIKADEPVRVEVNVDAEVHVGWGYLLQDVEIRNACFNTEFGDLAYSPLNLLTSRAMFGAIGAPDHQFVAIERISLPVDSPFLIDSTDKLLFDTRDLVAIEHSAFLDEGGHDHQAATEFASSFLRQILGFADSEQLGAIRRDRMSFTNRNLNDIGLDFMRQHYTQLRCIGIKTGTIPTTAELADRLTHTQVNRTTNSDWTDGVWRDPFVTPYMAYHH